MSSTQKPTGGDTTRRDFLKTSTVATGAALATGLLASGVHAAGDDTIKVGLIGCGGRGRGALNNVLHSARNVKIVALGDAFKDRLDSCLRDVTDVARSDKVKDLGNSVDIQGSYVGLDAYKKVIDSGANYIILATPPGFRPIHLQAAVAAGKNIFTEKPVATDTTGIHKVLAAYEEARKKGLAIVAGTQRRHQAGYIETMKRIHGDEIGELVGGRCYWNQGILWGNDRKPDMSDLTWQLRNWYNFTYLCGDHIVEQHVHNLDVINWAFKTHPVSAVGMGGCSRLELNRKSKNPKFGHIFDFFAIDFEYPNGVHVLSMCRQISNCGDNNISEAVVGTKGTSQVNGYRINNKRVFKGDETNPYVQEHTDLIDSIRAGKPLNELKTVAESTLTAIIGRMSAYTGKPVTWKWATEESKENLMPETLAWDMSLPVPPVAVPGTTELV